MSSWIASPRTNRRSSRNSSVDLAEQGRLPSPVAAQPVGSIKNERSGVSSAIHAGSLRLILILLASLGRDTAAGLGSEALAEAEAEEAEAEEAEVEEAEVEAEVEAEPKIGAKDSRGDEATDKRAERAVGTRRGAGATARETSSRPTEMGRQTRFSA